MKARGKNEYQPFIYDRSLNTYSAIPLPDEQGKEGHFFVFWGLLLDPNMPVSWSRVDPPHNKQQAQLAGGPNWSWQLAEISERRAREAHLAPSYQLAAS